MEEVSLCQVLAALILDRDGERLAVRYASVARREYWPDIKSQMAFEKKLVAKIPKASTPEKSETDVVVVEDQTVLFLAANDLIVCAVAAPGENELIVAQVVDCMWEAMVRAAPVGLLSNGPSKQLVIDYLTETYFFLDEIMDDGIVMEIDEAKVQARIGMHDEPDTSQESLPHAGGTSSGGGGQGLEQAAASARQKLSSLFGRG